MFALDCQLGARQLKTLSNLSVERHELGGRLAFVRKSAETMSFTSAKGPRLPPKLFSILDTPIAQRQLWPGPSSMKVIVEGVPPPPGNMTTFIARAPWLCLEMRLIVFTRLVSFLLANCLHLTGQSVRIACFVLLEAASFAGSEIICERPVRRRPATDGSSPMRAFR